MYEFQKRQIEIQLDEAGIGFGPGITEPTDPRTDGIPYPLTSSHEIKVPPKHDSPLYIMPVASDEPLPRLDWQRIIAEGIFAEVNNPRRIIN